MLDWNWNPRFDLDLLQRSLTIIAWSVVSKAVLVKILSIFALENYVIFPLDLISVLLLIGGFVKSSLQLNPKGKSVLITGNSTSKRSIFEKKSFFLTLQFLALKLNRGHFPNHIFYF